MTLNVLMMERKEEEEGEGEQETKEREWYQHSFFITAHLTWSRESK